jgi:uncharacterized membrane protein YjgN (DUF898 family)
VDAHHRGAQYFCMTETEKRLSYHGTGGSLLELMIMNAVKSVLTLGIYSFWARNNVREFHYSHTDLDGDRFSYHGTGNELLRGYFKAMAVLVLLGVGIALASGLTGGPNAPASTQAIITLCFYAALFVLGIFAVNSTRRYRLSRSAWRGIRFSYHATTEEFAKMMVKGAGLSIITLGFYSPWFQNQRREFLVNHARFGTEQFRYDGPADPLVKEWMKSLLLTIPTLGLVWIWYSAFQHRHFWSNTHVAGARFHSSAEAEDVFALTIINVLLGVFTLGLAAPWIITRTQSFWCSRITLVGAVDWAAIQQRIQEASTTAEGLADAMDVDVGLEM